MAAATLLLIVFPTFLGFFIGACLGSFATALIWRLPRKIPWIYESGDTGANFVRSQCPSCHRTLESKDLVPIFSWALQRGKCRTCHAGIGIIYPVIELICGILGAIFFFMIGISVFSAFLLLWMTFFIIQVLVFIKHRFWSRDVLIILLFLSFLLVMFTGF